MSIATREILPTAHVLSWHNGGLDAKVVMVCRERRKGGSVAGADTFQSIGKTHLVLSQSVCKDAECRRVYFSTSAPLLPRPANQTVHFLHNSHGWPTIVV